VVTNQSDTQESYDPELVYDQVAPTLRKSGVMHPLHHTLLWCTQGSFVFPVAFTLYKNVLSKDDYSVLSGHFLTKCFLSINFIKTVKLLNSYVTSLIIPQHLKYAGISFLRMFKN
jgi:hypothetical protein